MSVPALVATAVYGISRLQYHVYTRPDTPNNRYLDSLNEFASVGENMYVRVNGVDEEGRLSLAYVARDKDRPKPPNRRERRRAARGDKEAGENKGEFFVLGYSEFVSVYQ